MAALLKLNEIEKILKMGTFLIEGGLFNEWMSEAQQGEGKAAQEMLRQF